MTVVMAEFIWERYQDLPMGEFESEVASGFVTEVVLDLLSEPTHKTLALIRVQLANLPADLGLASEISREQLAQL